MKMVFALSLVFFFSLKSEAGYLTIVGKSQLSTQLVGTQTIHFQGMYEIENQGDETAYGVFPSFRLGSWVWAGNPADIVENNHFRWTIDDKVARAQVDCHSSEDCSENLPGSGVFPLRVLRHYKDANGYQFSSAEVQIIEIGSLSPSQRAVLHIPALQAKLELSGGGEKFNGKLEIVNSSDSLKRVYVTYHSAKELQIMSSSRTVEVAAHAADTFPVEIRNFSGILGSKYAVFGILEWETKGLRNTIFVPASVSLAKKDSSGWYLAAAIASFLMLVLGLYVLFRRRESLPKLSHS